MFKKGQDENFTRELESMKHYGNSMEFFFFLNMITKIKNTT